MSAAYARAAAGFIVQRAMTLPGAMQKDRLVRMQRDMDALAAGKRSSEPPLVFPLKRAA